MTTISSLVFKVDGYSRQQSLVFKDDGSGRRQCLLIKAMDLEDGYLLFSKRWMWQTAMSHVQSDGSDRWLCLLVNVNGCGRRQSLVFKDDRSGRRQCPVIKEIDSADGYLSFSKRWMWQTTMSHIQSDGSVRWLYVS